MSSESPLGSVDKALQTLVRLSTSGAAGETLAVLAADLKQNKASLHRALAALRHRGFVEQDPASGRYRLGTEMLAIANRYLSGDSLRHMLREPLRALSSRVEELCHLGVPSGTDIVYVDKVEPERAIRVWSEIGRRVPAITTAMGRAILSQSYRSRSSFLTRFADQIAERTPYTLRTPETLWQELSATRARGYAKEQQETEIGISCIGVALIRADQPIAAISITALHDRMSLQRMDELVGVLREMMGPALPPGVSLQVAQPTST